MTGFRGPSCKNSFLRKIVYGFLAVAYNVDLSGEATASKHFLREITCRLVIFNQ